MTATETHDQKIQSLQHSVLFLQQQHASTLVGLHQEIDKLQQKCSVLTFHLANVSNGTNALETGVPAIKDDQQSEIQEVRTENGKLTGIIEIRDKRILLLEGQLKSKEQKYVDDLKNFQRKNYELQHDVEQKASMIAYLTTQLHQSKLKLSQNASADTELVENRSSILSPSPPRGNPSPRRSKYNLRRTITSPAANVGGVIQEGSSHQLIASDHVLQNSLPKTNSTRFSSKYKQSLADAPRPAVGHSQAKRERELRLSSNRPKPSDYEDFIAMSRAQDVITKPNMVEPLPPITTRSGRQLRDSTVTSRLLRSKAIASSSGEVGTIILENKLTSPEKSYRTLQNSSSK